MEEIVGIVTFIRKHKEVILDFLGQKVKNPKDTKEIKRLILHDPDLYRWAKSEGVKL